MTEREMQKRLGELGLEACDGLYHGHVVGSQAWVRDDTSLRVDITASVGMGASGKECEQIRSFTRRRLVEFCEFVAAGEK